MERLIPPFLVVTLLSMVPLPLALSFPLVKLLLEVVIFEIEVGIQTMYFR